MAGATHGSKGHKAGHSSFFFFFFFFLLLLDSHHLGSSFVQVASRYHEVGNFKAGSAVKGKVKTPKTFNQIYEKKTKPKNFCVCLEKPQK